MMNLKFFDTWLKNWGKTKIGDSGERFSVGIIRAAIAGLVLAAFLVPHSVYGRENNQQKLPGQVSLRNQTKYETKIRESLNLQKDFGNPTLAHQALDHLFGAIKKEIKPKSKYSKEEAVEALKAIGKVLKTEGNFEYCKNILLINGFKKQNDGKRFIDCDDYAFIYLAVGEHLGLSLEPVYVPKHVFLMCRLSEKTRFYWEPTLATEKDAGFYKGWMNLTEESGYPKILDEKEFEAVQFCNLGLAWYESGDYAKAIELYKRAIELNPVYAPAFNNLGVAYAKQGRFDQALRCYKKATEIDPDYATAFNNIGVAFFKLNDWQKATEYFEKAVDADPDYDRAYSYKAAALMRKGERNKALKVLNKIREKKIKALNPSLN